MEERTCLIPQGAKEVTKGKMVPCEANGGKRKERYVLVDRMDPFGD